MCPWTLPLDCDRMSGDRRGGHLHQPVAFVNAADVASNRAYCAAADVHAGGAEPQSRVAADLFCGQETLETLSSEHPAWTCTAACPALWVAPGSPLLVPSVNPTFSCTGGPVQPKGTGHVPPRGMLAAAFSSYLCPFLWASRPARAFQQQQAEPSRAQLEE